MESFSFHLYFFFFKVWLKYRDIFVNSVIGCPRWPLLIFWRAFGSQWLAFLFTYMFVWQEGNIEIHFWFIVNNLLGNVSKSKNDCMVCWIILVRYGLFVQISEVLYNFFLLKLIDHLVFNVQFPWVLSRDNRLGTNF